MQNIKPKNSCQVVTFEGYKTSRNSQKGVLKLGLVTTRANPLSYKYMAKAFRPNKLYNREELLEIMGLSMSTLRGLIKRGKFLEPLHAARSERYIGRELNKYLERRVAKKGPNKWFTKEELDKRLAECERNKTKEVAKLK